MTTLVKCNKRARATPEQQSFLETAFASNPSPNCKVRENMAQRVGMTERSIQIWFQNRRAKVKLNQRKASIAMQEEVLRQHCLVAPCPPNQLPCNVLSIGAWQRVATGGDLVCSFADRRMIWTLAEGPHRFQISFPIELIGGIVAEFNAPFAQLSFNLLGLPDFALEVEGSFIPCTDFTEAMQASSNLRHTLLGDCQAMRMQMMHMLQIFPELSPSTQILPQQRRMSAIPNDLNVNAFPAFNKTRSLSLPTSKLFAMQPLLPDTMSPQSDLSNTFQDQSYMSMDFL